jgi:CubicO group peptidase (beta-lactamase class C family)
MPSGPEGRPEREVAGVAVKDSLGIGMPAVLLGISLLARTVGVALAQSDSVAPPDAFQEDARIFKEFEGGLERLRRLLRIPGMAAGVVKGRRLVWAMGFGLADAEKGVEASMSTPWHIASVTKTFAAVILLQLVEGGKLSLDDPLEKFGIKTDGWRVVRVRHILSHTSETEPGTFFRYSGRRWEHLARVIEQASGRPFKDLLADRIIKRLALRDTAPNKESESEVYPFEDVRRRAAVFYRLNKSLHAERQEPVLGFYAAGGLFSSVRDMAIWDAAIDAGLLLKPETRAAMFTPCTSPTGQILPHGLGWFCQDVRGVRLVWHFGWHPDHASAFLLKVPAKNLSFMIFANSDKLSQPFNLLHGNVLDSPAALLFLRTFVFPGDVPPEIVNGEAVTNDIVLKAGGWKPVLTRAEKALLFCFGLGFLSAPAFWIVDRITRSRRGRGKGKFSAGPERASRVVRLYALATVVLGFAFLGVLLRAPFLVYWPELPGWIDGISLIENIILALPTLLAVLTFGLLVSAGFVWVKAYWTLSGRLHFTILAALMAGFVLLLDNWHLVGLSYYWNYLLK